MSLITMKSSFEAGNKEMASITIHNLDDSIKAKLRLGAASHGRSEDEARTILRTTSSTSSIAVSTRLIRGSCNLVQGVRRQQTRAFELYFKWE